MRQTMDFITESIVKFPEGITEVTVAVAARGGRKAYTFAIGDDATVQKFSWLERHNMRGRAFSLLRKNNIYISRSGHDRKKIGKTEEPH